ncbi:hypothetical protein OIU78_013614 [Salix suchowensis]|nr:hypothetical protein OIU78_013614 [Salix suchowensis]
MSFVPRIELQIQEDKSILPVNQASPCPPVFFIKFRVNHSINVLYPTRKFQRFAGVETRICKLLEPVKIGQISTTLCCPLLQFLSQDRAERFFYRALEVFCVPVDQGVEDLANRFLLRDSVNGFSMRVSIVGTWCPLLLRSKLICGYSTGQE